MGAMSGLGAPRASGLVRGWSVCTRGHVLSGLVNPGACPCMHVSIYACSCHVPTPRVFALECGDDPVSGSAHPGAQGFRRPCGHCERSAAVTDDSMATRFPKNMWQTMSKHVRVEHARWVWPEGFGSYLQRCCLPHGCGGTSCVVLAAS